MSMHSLFDAAATEANKIKRATGIRTLIAEGRKQVDGKKSEAKATRDKMVADAVALCTAVKNNCL